MKKFQTDLILYLVDVSDSEEKINESLKVL